MISRPKTMVRTGEPAVPGIAPARRHFPLTPRGASRVMQQGTGSSSAKTALTQLNQGQSLCQWVAHDADSIIALTAPHDLQERLGQLPREVQADNDFYSLCADANRMATAIETARQARAEEDTWPQLHYLWAQHPIMDWLGDRVLTHFGRPRAPLAAPRGPGRGPAVRSPTRSGAAAPSSPPTRRATSSRCRSGAP